MYQVKNFSLSFLLLGFCLLSSNVCLAQEPLSFSVNETEVNLRTGIALADYQQLDKVSLKVKGAQEEQEAVFEEIRVFRARGARPLQQLTYLQPGEGLDITALLRQAEKGDRLVIELISSAAADDETRQSQVVNLNLY